jgi:hypothetical protein
LLNQFKLLKMIRIDSKQFSSTFNRLKSNRSSLSNSEESSELAKSGTFDDEIVENRAKIRLDLCFFDTRFVSHVIEIFSNKSDHLASLKFSIYKYFMSIFLWKKLVDSNNKFLEEREKNLLEFISIDYHLFVNKFIIRNSLRELIENRKNVITTRHKYIIYLNFINCVENEQIIRTWYFFICISKI